MSGEISNAIAEKLELDTNQVRDLSAEHTAGDEHVIIEWRGVARMTLDKYVELINDALADDHDHDGD